MKACKRRGARKQHPASSLHRLGQAAWVIALAAGATGLAQALDLGEAKARLLLGQPLRVDLPLLLSPGESTDDLQVSVRGRAALSAEGDAAWMQGPFRIIFTSLDGLPGLRICHEQPLQEPIVELHLALRAANGTIVRRRYDLLTDPPQSGGAAPACEPQSAAVVAAPRTRAERVEKRVPRPAATARGRTSGGTLVVPGDTLSEVAQALRGNRPIALPVLVDALYQANPDAFTGSADKLRAGSRLTMPDMRGLAADVPAATRAAEIEPTNGPAEPVLAGNASSALPDTIAYDWTRRLQLSTRLSTLPTAAEQRRVAERYIDAAAPVVPQPIETKIETSIATPIEVSALPVPSEARSRSISATLGEMPAWLRNAVAALIIALLLGLAFSRKKQPRRRPAAAKPLPIPLAHAVSMPVTPVPVAALPNAPLPLYSRTQDAAQEVGRDFYDEVATLLIATLQQNPERRDLRFRLLDLYFTSGKRDAFIEHTRGYLASLGGTPDENWPEIVRMGQQLAPETGLYSAQPGAFTRATVIPLQGARSAGVRRFYENADATPLRVLREHLDRAYTQLRRDNDFWRELAALSREWLSPDPGLTPAERLTSYLGGGRILFRDERRRDTNEDAALVAIGQVLIARRLGYRRVVAGGMQARHALLAAQAAQRLGLQCVMHLSEAEQIHNAGALERVVGMHARIETLPDASFGLAASAQLCALNDALGSHDSLYISPAEAGPPPYPTIVVDLVAMQGRKLRANAQQLLGRHADVLITHSGDGLHTLGTLEAFLDAGDTRLLCMESGSRPHAGLLFPREHRLLRATGRVDYQHIAEEAARFTTQFCAEREYATLTPAGSEVFAAALRAARDLSASQSVVAVLPSEMAILSAQLAAEAETRGDATRVVPLPRA